MIKRAISILTFSRLVTWITFLAIFAMAIRVSIDTDTWWHLRAGQWIVENGRIITTDYFSYTRFGQSWNYPGWIIEILMYLIYQLWGPGGLNILTSSLVTLTFIIIWYACSGSLYLKALTIILAATTSAIFWSARPHLITLLMMAVFLLILEKDRWLGDRRINNWVYLLPIFMVFWVNSHGGFVIGFIIWGIYMLPKIIVELKFLLDSGGLSPQNIMKSKEIKMIGLISGLLILAACINPSGIEMLVYPLKTVGMDALKDYIQEWQTPDFHQLSNQPFIWLVMLTFLAAGLANRRLHIIDILLFMCFFYLAMLAGRNIALFALCSPVIVLNNSSELLPIWLTSRIDKSEKNIRKALLNWIIFILLAAITIIKAKTVLPETANMQYLSEFLPIAAVEKIEELQPPERIFNSYNWGAYMIYALPSYQVFLDGRTDLYDDEIIQQWLHVVQGESGWEQILDEWGVNTILLEHSAPLIRELKTAGWRLEYSDNISVIYVR